MNCSHQTPLNHISGQPTFTQKRIPFERKIDESAISYAHDANLRHSNWR